MSRAFTQAEIDHASKAFGPVIVPELAVFVDVDDESVAKDLATYTIKVPATVEALTPLLTIVPLQLLSYYVADLRGTDVDIGFAL